MCVCYTFATARVRRPIGLRPPSDQIAFGVRSDCVRYPIGLRSVPDQIAFGARWQLVGGYGIPIYPLQNDKKRLNACGYSLSLEKKE